MKSFLKIVLATFVAIFLAFILSVVVFFGVIGAIKKNKLTAETRMLNDREANELSLRKTEKELTEKLHALEQQIASLKK